MVNTEYQKSLTSSLLYTRDTENKYWMVSRVYLLEESKKQSQDKIRRQESDRHGVETVCENFASWSTGIRQKTWFQNISHLPIPHNSSQGVHQLSIKNPNVWACGDHSHSKLHTRICIKYRLLNETYSRLVMCVFSGLSGTGQPIDKCFPKEY